MDELSKLSPASRERNLDELPRKELQQLAKEAGVKGNIKSKEIVQSLLRCLEGGEAVPGTTVKAKPSVSAQASACADTVGRAGSDASHANSNTAFSIALAEAAADPSVSLPKSKAPGDVDSTAVHNDSNNQDDTGVVSLLECVPSPAEVADDSAVVPQASTGTGTASPAAGVDMIKADSANTASIAEAAPAEQVPAVAKMDNDPDCIGNPLYEEPDPVRPVPVPAELALQPALQSHAPEGHTEAIGPCNNKGMRQMAGVSEAQLDAKVHSSLAVLDAVTDSSPVKSSPGQDSKRNSDSQMLAVQSGTAAEGEDHMRVSASEEQNEEMDELLVSTPEGLTGEEDYMQVSTSEEPSKEQNQVQANAPEGPTEQEEPNKEQEQLQVSAPEGPEEDHMQVTASGEQDQQQVCASEGPTAEEGPMQVSASEEPCEPGLTVSGSEEEQRRRADTPEELANLGKAVDMVQARSCQLSPSLLTVGQTPPDMDSPARHAFERGRKSGIWQGSTEVELQQLERQWDDYKSVATRGWDLPNLQEVQAKSDALEASGFATVHSPIISKATQAAMAQQGARGGKRKAPSEDGEEAAANSKASGQPRKAVKRAQGHTPSRKGPGPGIRGQSPAQRGPGPSPLRRGAQGPSRLAQSTRISDIENAAKAANSVDQGKPEASEGKAATPLRVGAATRDVNTGVKTTKATGIPKPRPAVDRAKKAEATFAARRAAALAKVKK